MVHPRGSGFFNLFALIRRSKCTDTVAHADHEPPGAPPPAGTLAAALAVIVLAAFPIVSAARTLNSDGFQPESCGLESRGFRSPCRALSGVRSATITNHE